MSECIVLLGAGFIGSHIIRFYAQQGRPVRVLDLKARPADCPAGVEWHSGSYADSALLEKILDGADAVFHLVANTVPADHSDEQDELNVNVVQTVGLLKACIRAKVRRLFFFSSSAVYGPQEKMPISEIALPRPISSHAINKLTIEHFLGMYAFHHRLDVKVLRLSNPFGPGQPLRGRQGFIAIAIGKLLDGGPVIIRGDGSAVRDFIYIDDVVRACELLRVSRTEERVFNIGSGRGRSVLSVVEEICKMTGKDLPVIFQPANENEIQSSVLDVRKARKLLGFTPEVGFSEALEKTYDSHAATFRSSV